MLLIGDAPIWNGGTRPQTSKLRAGRKVQASKPEEEKVTSPKRKTSL